jgi:signal transduction histidine kinase
VSTDHDRDAGRVDPASEAGLLAAVQRSAILDLPADGPFGRIARLAALIFDVPIATVSIADHERIWLEARDRVGIDPGVDLGTLADPLVRDELGLRFYASAPLRTSDGRELGALSVVDTEPREASEPEQAILEELAGVIVDELELRLAAREEAERSTRVRADFVVTAAHELRTPLAAVYGAAKLLGQDKARDDRERAKLLTVIADESERLSVVVGEILTGAQLDVGHLELVNDRCDPVALAVSAVDAAEAHLPANLSVRLLAGNVLQIDSDAVRIRQILASLIDNAVKYSPDGGRIEVAVEPLERGVRFRISDEGIGVPAEAVERIFERFTRVDADRTRGVGGTGLGLYIAREMAGLLGGTLTHLERDGEGSTFALDLPAVLSSPARPSA